MLADKLINALRFFISDFITQPESTVVNLEPREYERQLLNSYNKLTDGIIYDIKADLEWFSKEHNEYLKQGFLNQIPPVKDHINALLQNIETIEMHVFNDCSAIQNAHILCSYRAR